MPRTPLPSVTGEFWICYHVYLLNYFLIISQFVERNRLSSHGNRGAWNINIFIKIRKIHHYYRMTKMGYQAKKFSLVRFWDRVGSQVLKWECAVMQVVHILWKLKMIPTTEALGKVREPGVPQKRASDVSGQCGREAKKVSAPLVILPQLRDIPKMGNLKWYEGP